ncbi:Salicylate hydroxylase [Cytospora mali]|uniref:Salicylate hydroxylase n=1 Tax=Cytospora mali TaxID=578113 RepID=A0A194W0Y1_CYTMA|nr:Salicylate hydroxylase [Valsa mali]
MDREISDHQERSHDLDVAIVGGGIVGVIIALGLLHHGIRVHIFEQAPDFHEIGAGLAFTGVSRECMRQLNPAILDALERISNKNRHPYYRYWDGYNQAPTDGEKPLFELSMDGMNFWACLRTDFLRELAAQLPTGIVTFDKQLVDYDDGENGGTKVCLRFDDGTEAKADVVVGCDGIKSRTRQVLLGPGNPQAYSSYSHKVAYRAVMPMSKGIDVLGEDKANNQCLFMGPDAHILTYPIANFTLVNVVIVVSDPTPWPSNTHTTGTSDRTEVEKAMIDWAPPVRKLVGLLPETINKWALFDMASNPASTYARGRVCLAGDAAHASSPHHGAGASMGVEDGLALVKILDTLRHTEHSNMGANGAGCPKAVPKSALNSALEAYNSVRLGRTQWVVKSSRETGDIYEWAYPASGRDVGKCKAEIEKRTRTIWDFDVDNMVAEARIELGRRLRCV